MCKSRSQKLLLIKTPTYYRDFEQPYYNRVSEIAEEYQIEFLNFNTLDEQTTLTSDDYWNDGVNHMNTRGARKVSNYLGKVLTERYGIVNRHNDSKYESWNVNATEIQNEYIATITDNDEYFKELQRDDRSVFMVKNQNWQASVGFVNLLTDLRIITTNSEIMATSDNGIWMLDSSSGNEQLMPKYSGDGFTQFDFDDSKFAVDFVNGKVLVNNKNVCSLTEGGIVCVVYDKKINQCVDVSVFTYNKNFAIRHIDEWKNSL